MHEGLQRSNGGTGAPEHGEAFPVVVVGVDGSAPSRCAALAASSAARSLGAAVVAVHVPLASPWLSMACWLGGGHLVAETAELATSQIEADLAPLFELEGVPWRFVVARGSVGGALGRTARELHATVVVVGAPRRTLRARLRHVLVPDVPRLLLRRGTDRLLVA
jgi:nucleotide-binding universal stress UspA family protein